jgi:hypothetical protein
LIAESLDLPGRYPKGWHELNFVPYVDVWRHLIDRRARFCVEGSVMHDLMARLLNDPIFAERMPAIVRAVGACCGAPDSCTH